ncbi:MAG: hypothetical protein A2X54_01470 [Nitrospirae bacterium GWF2_44_13]|nr:MAG: hypothetical protein A2X54_01470 [Nitrospirae bacterium GWF2_44_13]OGW64103.1 MAG: hypothetical protein A2222_03195 [Nitrospirae bacterium RIFOXYA2_FULL_44_9]
MSKVSGEDVIAPPYDIIAPEYKEKLYGKSPHNIVRIDFGKELEGDNELQNKYTRASGYLSLWLKDGILHGSKTPAFYAYEVDYSIKGSRKRLRGFFSLVRLEELGRGVYPHECTHSKPKADRLNLLRTCRANISPIFSLYNSPGKKASEIINRDMLRKPYMEAKDSDGAIHRLWIVDAEEDIEIIRNDLKGKPVFIADGHHRYETALEFKKIMDSETSSGSPIHRFTDSPKPWDYVLMFLANMSDEGLTILPAHRLVKKLPENSLDILSQHFTVEILSSKDDIAGALSGYEHAIGFCHRNSDNLYLLRHKGHKGAGLENINPALKELDVTILHELIFKKLLNITEVTYEMDTAETRKMVRKGIYDGAFFLNPTGVKDVERVALSGERMPPKSTYFYPKLLTGMVMYKFND